MQPVSARVIRFVHSLNEKTSFRSIELKKISMSIPASNAPWLSFLLALIGVTIYTVALTHGTLNLNQPEVGGAAYVSQLDNLKQGRFDVDPEAIGNEAFVREGKAYMYFGIFPVFVRSAFELFLARNGRDWSRPSVLLASFVALWALFSILGDLIANLGLSKAKGIFLYSLLTFGWLFGSPIWLLMSCANIYHEAIIWSFAWCMIFIHTYLQWRKHGPSVGRCSLLAISAGCAILSRTPTGVGPLIILTVLFLELIIQFWFTSQGRETTRRASLSLIIGPALLSVFLFTAVLVNWGRWGHPLRFLPYQYSYVDLTVPRGMALYLQKGAFHYSYTLPAIEYYFFPNRDNFVSTFPFVVTTSKTPWFESRRTGVDYIEPYNVSMTLSSPLMILIILIGAIFIFRAKSELKLLFCAFSVQAVLILFFHALCLRYQVDFVPAVFVMSMPVLPWIASIFKHGGKQSLIMLLCLIFIVGGSTYLTTITMRSYRCPVIYVPDDLKSLLQETRQQKELLTSSN